MKKDYPDAYNRLGMLYFKNKVKSEEDV